MPAFPKGHIQWHLTLGIGQLVVEDRIQVKSKGKLDSTHQYAFLEDELVDDIRGSQGKESHTIYKSVEIPLWNHFLENFHPLEASFHHQWHAKGHPAGTGPAQVHGLDANGSAEAYAADPPHKSGHEAMALDGLGPERKLLLHPHTLETPKNRPILNFSRTL